MSSQHPPIRNVERVHSMKSNAGFGLIEILVALLVLAIGLLGLASLQTTALTQSAETRNRSQAILLADDMIERIRSNRGVMASYAVAAAASPACNQAFKVANTSVVSDDISEWKNSLSCLLPGGNGTVQINGQVATVAITWSANTGGSDDGSVTLEARL